MAQRKDSVRRETRPCEKYKHGDSEHALRTVGSSAVLKWYCMPCESARTNQRNKDRRAGLPPSRSENVKASTRELKFCPKHPSLALPLSGICDDC